MAWVDSVISVTATVIGSVTVAFVIDSIRTRRQRNTMRAALRTEILANLTTATRMKTGYQTIFELSNFENIAYRNALASGVIAALPDDTLSDLSRLYDLMAMHDRQTIAQYSSAIPRTLGYFERVSVIEELLKKMAEITDKW
jgi:hypothetical protein